MPKNSVLVFKKNKNGGQLIFVNKITVGEKFHSRHREDSGEDFFDFLAHEYYPGCEFEYLDTEQPTHEAMTPRTDNHKDDRESHVYQDDLSLQGQWKCDGNVSALNARGIDSHGKWGRKKPSRRSAKGRRWEARATHRHRFGF